MPFLSSKKTGVKETPRTFTGRSQKHFSPKNHLLNSADRRQEEKASIKTSSLFKNNPAIPELHRCVQVGCRCSSGTAGAVVFGRLLTLALVSGFCRPVVKQAREQVFTPEAFHELGLHPHLVSTLQHLVGLHGWCVCVCPESRGQHVLLPEQFRSAEVAAHSAPSFS